MFVTDGLYIVQKMGCLHTRQADCLKLEEEVEREVLATLHNIGMYRGGFFRHNKVASISYFSSLPLCKWEVCEIERKWLTSYFMNSLVNI